MAPKQEVVVPLWEGSEDSVFGRQRRTPLSPSPSSASSVYYAKLMGLGL